MWASGFWSPTPRTLGLRFTGAAVEQAKKRDALVTVEHRSHLIEECHRRAAEAGVWLTPMASHRTRETISLKWNGGGCRWRKHDVC